MSKYKIAGLAISIENQEDRMFPHLKQYEVLEESDIDFRVSTRPKHTIQYPPGELISEEEIVWLNKQPGDPGYLLYMFLSEKRRQIACLLDVDKRWELATITYLGNNPFHENEEFYKTFIKYKLHQLLGVAFRYRLLLYDGIVVHASTIKFEDKGIIFTAASGTGKSTHVKLWQKHLGARVNVLNDDTPAIRLIDGNPWVFGTPWGGSSNIHCNDSAPLAAIVILQQNEQNSIRRLDIREAVALTAPRFFLPYIEEDLMARALSNVEKTLSSVPVYLLKCKPDQEAMELVYKCLM